MTGHTTAGGTTARGTMTGRATAGGEPPVDRSRDPAVPANPPPHRPGPAPSGTTILVAIGANLPAPDGTPPLETCRRAIDRLAALPGLAVVAVSRWYETAPVPPSGQPPYVNGVARLSAAAEVDPVRLLADLLAIEAACGRERGVANAARTLDLDLIAIGDVVRDAPDPILPHPRAHLRGFVLRPLVDVAPEWVHPRLGRTARALLAALPPETFRVLAARAADPP